MTFIRTYITNKKIIWFVFHLILLFALYVSAEEGRWKTYTVADGLPNPDITIIFQDRLGNMWFGARSGGISRFDGDNFYPFGYQYGLPDDGVIKNILEDGNGNLWFIVNYGGNFQQESSIYRYDGKEFHRITQDDGLPGGIADRAIKDRKGNLWFASKYGLTKYDGKDFHSFDHKDFLKSFPANKDLNISIHDIFESSQNEIWICGNSAIRNPENVGPEPRRFSPFIIRFNGSKFQNFALDSFQGIFRAFINHINEDNHGNIWFAGFSVLLRYNGKEFERFDKIEPLDNQERPAQGEILLKWKEPLSKTGKPLIAVTAGIPGPPGTIGDIPAVPPDNRADGERGFRYRSRRARISVESVFRDKRGYLWFNNRGFISCWNDKELQNFVIPENWNEIEKQDWLTKDKTYNIYPGNLALEDALGNIWFRSKNGAYKWNGKEFTTFNVDTGLGSNNISVIFEAMDGKLWFGHDNGVTLFDPTPPIIKNFTTRATIGSDSVYSIYEDKKGVVWFSVMGGVVRYIDGELEYFSGKDMSHWQKGYANTSSPIDTNFLTTIFKGKGSSLWFVGNDTSQIFRYENGIFYRYSLWRDRTRPINRGIYDRFGPGSFDWMSRKVLAVDGEGNLYFAVGGSLVKCDGKDFYFLTPDSPQDSPGDMMPGRPRERNNNRGISDIYVDKKGIVWSVADGNVIRKYDGSAIITIDKSDVGEINIRRIFEDRRGNLWFAGEKNLIKYDGKSSKIFSGLNTMGIPWAIHEDNNGLISFIYPNSVGKFDGENLRVFERNAIRGPTLGDRQVRKTITDSSGNLWLATNNGVVKYNGQQFITYNTRHGLLVNDIRDLKEDSQGNIWCSTWGGGVAVYNGESFQSITTKDGIVHNNVRSILQDSRRNLWFATDGGITKYVFRTNVPPRARLTKLTADRVYTQFDEEIKLPGKVHQLIFEYQGVGLQQGNLLFTYKLEGRDKGWSEPSVKKQAIYNGLRPGNYTFLVKALKMGSPYSNPPATFKFTLIQPFWYQPQFYIPIILFIITLSSIAFLVNRLIAQRKRASILRAELIQKEEAEIQRVRRELNDAREIQMGLLPRLPPRIHHFELAGISIPAREVGGDFYDYLTLKGGLVVIALADASGKGLRGAMSAVMSNGMLREVVRVESQADSIVSRLNAGLKPMFQDSMFTALNLCVIDPYKEYIQYTNAGQPYPIIKRGREAEYLELGGLPLGIMPDVLYDKATISLYPEDYVILYTDGVSEAMNEAEEIYGFDRLKETVIKADPNLSSEGMLRHILQDVQAFMGKAEQFDDMTIVVLRFVKPKD